MIINSSLDEVKRRESALKYIASQVKEKGRNSLHDLSGLAGGFPVSESDLTLLETYAGPAYFSKSLQKGIIHLGGEKVLAFNRTSAAILATILAFVKPEEECPLLTPVTITSLHHAVQTYRCILPGI